MAEARQIRVLHVVGAMNRGGVETWLMHVLRSIDRERYRLDFLVHTDRPAVHDAEIERLGGTVLRAGEPRRLAMYARRFSGHLRDGEPYDVVHSHVHHFSGVTLALACRAGVPVRIAHSHNTIPTGGSRRRRVYLGATETLIRRYSTRRLAASEAAAVALYGDRWRADPGYARLVCGIDLAPFAGARAATGAVLRAALGIPGDAFVVGHVGRFDRQKNHEYLLEIAAATIGAVPNARFLLVGEGELRERIEREAAARGLGGRVVFTGSRGDVPALMTQVMDAFVLPSLHEGLPLVGVEGQAAGLPCLFSDAVTREVSVVDENVAFLPLDDPRVWSRRLAEVAAGGGRECAERALASVAASPFNIDNGIGRLEAIYDGA